MQTESRLGKVDTKLAIIIDPPNQTPVIASLRVGQFIQRGGRGVLVGGSGAIEKNIFQDTVAGIVDVTTKYNSIPVWILPGHFDQIPANERGVTGVLNYAYIMGDGGNNFDIIYPPNARQLVSQILQSRGIPSISTLYVLCGDPNASVSKVSGIYPLDLNPAPTRERFLRDTSTWLERDIQCVFFESGSNSGQPLNPEIVVQTRQLIDKVKADTTLMVSGGISKPSFARLYAGFADYIVVGGHFERNGVRETNEFVSALKV